MSRNHPTHFTNIRYPHTATWDKTGNHVKFTLQDVHYSLANGVRRAMIAKVPTIGFKSEPAKYSTIKVERNDTYLNNEIISHRLAMLPINVPHPDTFDTEEYVFHINEENDTNGMKLLTTEHIKVKRISTNTFLSEKETRDLLPADPNTGHFIPIVKLEPKHYTDVHHSPEVAASIAATLKVPVSEAIGLRLSAKVVKSNGDENGHFSPVAACAYGNTIDEEKAATGMAEFIANQNAFTAANNLTAYPEETLKRRFNLNEIQKHFKTDEYGDPSSFDFTLESVGVIPPLICLERGFRWIVDSLAKLITNLETGNNQVITITPVASMGNGFTIRVEGEDDTLGNIIHSHMVRAYADYTLEPTERKLASCSYHKTHPLERRIIFTLKPIDSSTPEECIKTVFIPGLNDIAKFVNELIGELTVTPEYIHEAKRV